MRGERRRAFLYALVGTLIGSLVVTLTPALAAVGDALLQGNVNTVNQKTTLRGNAPANLKLQNTSSNGTALELRVGAGNPPLDVNSDIRVKDLNADMLDGLHANETVRVAFDSGVGGNVGTPGSLPAATSIEVPGSGYLLIEGNAGVGIPAPHIAGAKCDLLFEGASIPGTARALLTDAPEALICSTLGLKKVTFPGTYEVALSVAAVEIGGPGPGVVTVNNAAVSVIYIPWGGEGKSPPLILPPFDPEG